MKSLLLATLAMALAVQAPHAQDATQEKAAPCSSPECSQFDFWVGHWAVTANNTQAGTNRITKILGGCVLMEEWEGAGNFRGKSFNRFDSATGKWEQFWVDNQGGALKLSGTYADGKMVMSGESVGPNGPVMDRITWHNKRDGDVRQLWEKSTDGGKSWAVAFDGLYKRKG